MRTAELFCVTFVPPAGPRHSPVAVRSVSTLERVCELSEGCVKDSTIGALPYERFGRRTESEGGEVVGVQPLA